LDATCQRCHETLREADRYCPACGMPQLTYVPSDAPLIELGTLAEGLAVVAEPIGPSSGLAWRPALNAAVMMAIPSAVLWFVMDLLGLSLAILWMVGAAALAVAVYRRNTRIASLTTGAGARIGFVTGLMACWLMLALTGTHFWMQRAVFHQGPQLDADWAQLVEKNYQQWQQTYVQMGVATATAAQSSQLTRAWMLSPEGHIGAIFFDFLLGATFLTVFASLGGAASARLSTPTRRHNT